MPSSTRALSSVAGSGGAASEAVAAVVSAVASASVVDADVVGSSSVVVGAPTAITGGDPSPERPQATAIEPSAGTAAPAASPRSRTVPAIEPASPALRQPILLRRTTVHRGPVYRATPDGRGANGGRGAATIASNPPAKEAPCR